MQARSRAADAIMRKRRYQRSSWGLAGFPPRLVARLVSSTTGVTALYRAKEGHLLGVDVAS
jgi:hypothetical protein